MKQKILQWGVLVVKVASLVVLVLPTLGLPEKTVLLIFMIASTAKDLTNRVCDQLDDGKLNNSFNPDTTQTGTAYHGDAQTTIITPPKQ